MRLLFKGTSIPYTVIMIITGLVFGSITNHYEDLQSYTKMARMDPHLMLYVFLPTLIFESAFVMDVHILRRVFSQILLLAGPGMMLVRSVSLSSTCCMLNALTPLHLDFVGGVKSRIRTTNSVTIVQSLFACSLVRSI